MTEDPELQQAWVQLYDNDHHSGRMLVVSGGTDYANLKDAVEFEDKPTSAKWNIPQGWRCVLYEGSDYKGKAYPLKGVGENPNVGDFGGEVSSLRWERD